MADAEGKFRLDLIGPFGLFDPAGRRINVTSKKSMALIALLAMAPNGVRTRIWLQNMLWETRSTAQAQGSFRRELSTLIKLLDAHGAGFLLIREQARVSIALDRIDVDALSLAIGLGGRSTKAGSDFLEGIDLGDCEAFEDWLREQRSRCDDLRNYSLPETSQLLSAQQVLGAPLPPTADILSSAPYNLPPKPSVAVLPLATRSRDDSDRYLGAGIAEEIEMTLARFRTMFVVASGSARALAERNLTRVEIAQQLGVRYLIDGTVRKDGGNVRINISLLDGQTGHQLWAHHYDGEMDNIFDLQEQIAREVAPRIHSQIDTIELRAGLSNPARSGDAYQLYWRANALFRQWEKSAIIEALGLCEQLVEMEPTSPWAAAMAAFCHGTAYTSGWTDDPVATRRTAIAHYQNAMRHGGNDPTVLGYAAGTLVTIGGDMKVADRLIAHALSLLPAYQPTLFWGGWVDIAMGNAERARERFELTLRINPEAGARAYAITGIGIALLMQGDVKQAYAMLDDAYQYIPTYPMTLAALCVAAALTGELEVARRTANELRQNGGVDQVLAVLQKPEHRALLVQGLSLAEPVD